MNVLDRDKEEDVAGLLMDTMEETGYAPEEFIPGLILAARLLAANSSEEGQVLDEIFNLLEETDE